MDLFDLSDNIISIDAIGTQTAIMDKILQNKGHYLLSVKSNQSSLLEEIKADTDMASEAKKNERIFHSRIGEDISYLISNHEEYESVERNRERIEHRKITILRNTCLSSRTENCFDSIRTIGILKQVRIPVEKDREGNDITVDYDTFITKGSNYKPDITTGDDFSDDIQYSGIISDLDLNAEQMMKMKREHWLIENSLHHVLDDTFREDRSPAKKSKGNLSLIRKIAYNLLRISMIAENINTTVIERMDDFADNFSLFEKYVISPIESFY